MDDYLLLEDGQPMTTEAGDRLIVEKNSAMRFRLSAENGKSLTTQAGRWLLVERGSTASVEFGAVTVELQDDGTLAVTWGGEFHNVSAFEILHRADGEETWQVAGAVSGGERSFNFIADRLGETKIVALGADGASSGSSNPATDDEENAEPPPGYAVIELGVGEEYYGKFLNDKLQVVLEKPTGDIHGSEYIFYDFDRGAITPMAIPIEYESSFGLDAFNNQGIVLGHRSLWQSIGYPGKEEGEILWHIFIWAPGQGLYNMLNIKLPPSLENGFYHRLTTEAYDISDSGVIVGYCNDYHQGGHVSSDYMAGLKINVSGQTTVLDDLIWKNVVLLPNGNTTQTAFKPFAINNNNLMLAKRETWKNGENIGLPYWWYMVLEKTEYCVGFGNNSLQVLDGEPKYFNDTGLIVGVSGSGTPLLWEAGETGIFAPKVMLDGIVGPISNKGQIINGRYLWQKNRRYEFSRLIPEEQGWKNIGAVDINNHGVVLAHAAKTKDGEGQPISEEEQQRRVVLLVPIEINHADGEEINQPMKYLPQWIPNDGIGKGEPIYDTPSPLLKMSDIGATMQVTVLGNIYQLDRNATNSLLFENTVQGISVLLNQTALADNSVLESLTAIVSAPSLGMHHSRYDCDETAADSSVFENVIIGVIMTLSGLETTIPNNMVLQLYYNGLAGDMNLVETGPDTKVFVNGGTTVQVVGNPVIGGTMDLAITSAAHELSNTVVRVQWNGQEYRNFTAPVSTNMPAEEVPDFAAFYIQVPVNLFAEGETPKIKLLAKVENSRANLRGAVGEGEEEIAEVELIQTVDGKWRSKKKLVLLGKGADTSQMASDKAQFQTIQWPAGARMDWTENGGVLLVKYRHGETYIRVQASGIVLQSLDFYTKFGQDLNPEKLIRKPFQKMGYTMYRDYNAKTLKTINEYILEKQIWYSISHGARWNGEFVGLHFNDFVEGGSIPLITGNLLQPLKLNYCLVIVDGCLSAQTGLSESEAMYNDDLHTGAKSLADAFGHNAEYIGWGWEMNPHAAQVWSSEFVNNLKGGFTVRQAFNKFRNNHQKELAAKLMKLYGIGNAVIDLKEKYKNVLST